jgi:hypothetical protein
MAMSACVHHVTGVRAAVIATVVAVGVLLGNLAIVPWHEARRGITRRKPLELKLKRDQNGLSACQPAGRSGMIPLFFNGNRDQWTESPTN